VGENFASILLALPVAEVEDVSDGEKATASDPAIAEDSLAPADPQFLATLGLPPLKPVGDAATGELKLPTQPVAGALLAPTSGRIEKDPLADQDRGQRQPGKQPLLRRCHAADKAGKFCRCHAALPTSEQAAPGKTEPLSAVNDPNAVATPLSSVCEWRSRQPGNSSRSEDAPAVTPHGPVSFGQKLLWFAASDKQLAQLTLNPPQLGAIEITLKIDKDSANAHFVSANADVRGAIEAALPRLREMFANAGIDLGQVSVGSESFRQSADSQGQASGPPRAMADTAILGADSVSALLGQSIVTQRGSTLVDIFA
jgi:hypothetical protein